MVKRANSSLFVSYFKSSERFKSTFEPENGVIELFKRRIEPFNRRIPPFNLPTKPINPRAKPINREAYHISLLVIPFTNAHKLIWRLIKWILPENKRLNLSAKRLFTPDEWINPEAKWSIPSDKRIRRGAKRHASFPDVCQLAGFQTRLGSVAEILRPAF